MLSLQKSLIFQLPPYLLAHLSSLLHKTSLTSTWSHLIIWRLGGGGGGGRRKCKVGGKCVFSSFYPFFLFWIKYSCFTVLSRNKGLFIVVSHLTNSLRGNSSLQVCICSFNKIITFKIHSLEEKTSLHIWERKPLFPFWCQFKLAEIFLEFTSRIGAWWCTSSKTPMLRASKLPF